MVEIYNLGGHVETITPLSFYHFWSMRRLLRRLRKTLKHAYPEYEALEKELTKIEEDEALGNEDITKEEMEELANVLKNVMIKLNDIFKKVLEEEYDEEKEEEEKFLREIPFLYQQDLHINPDHKNKLLELLGMIKKSIEEYEEKVLFEEEKGFKIAELEREAFLQYIQGLRNDAMLFAQMIREIREETEVMKEEERLRSDFLAVINEIKKKKEDNEALTIALEKLETTLRTILQDQQKEITLLHNLVHKTFILFFHIRKIGEKAKEFINEIKQEGFDEAKAKKLQEKFDELFEKEKESLNHYLAMVYFLKNHNAREKALLEKEVRKFAQAA